MKENTITTQINSPVSKVFSFTIDPAKTPLWIDSIIKEEANEVPVRLGTSYKNQNKAGEWSEYKVVQFVKDQLFELATPDGAYHVRYTYKEIYKDKTSLTYFEWKTKGDLTDPFSPLTLEKLKKAIEQV